MRQLTIRTASYRSMDCSVALLFMLASIIGITESKTYTLPQGWSSRNGPNLPEFQASNGSIYRLITASSTSSDQLVTITSDNGTFGLAFFRFSNSSNAFYLSLILGVGKAWGVPVWSANRNNPIGENATLLLTEKNSLSLQDHNSTVVWTSSVVDIASLDLSETGNLTLLNNTEHAIWQSFDYPTDALLPGQGISTGQKLVSSASNSTLEEGVFEAVIGGSGIIMYLNMSNSTQPYYVWSLNGSEAKSALLQCSPYVTTFTFTGNSFEMGYRLPSGIQQNASSPCSSDVKVSLTRALSNAWIFVRIESNGDLIVFSHGKDDNSSSGWDMNFQLGKYIGGECYLPLTCGPYGICSNDACKCPVQSRKGEVYVDSSGKCTEPSWAGLDCVHNEADNKHFLKIPDVTYSSVDFYGSPDKISTLEDCKNLCLANCSCHALFFDDKNGHCYFLDQVLGSMTEKIGTVTGFLKFRNAHTKHSNRLLIILVSIAVVLLISLVVAVLILWINLRKSKCQLEIILSSLEGPPQRFTYKQLQASTKRFSNKLGSGGFGTVFKGSLSNGKQLAVKKLESSSQGQKEFITEVISMGSISHTNIVRLYGFCAEKSRKLLVYEYMPNGSLDKWLFYENEEPVLDWKTRFQIALGTARGLAYLHNECHVTILHLDIKPQNILLDDCFNAKIADFGMAKLLGGKDITHAQTSMRGTPGYLAPEWLIQCMATKKCDVYSYGMVLLELVGGRRNLDRTKAETEHSWYFPAWVVNEMKEGRMKSVVDPKLSTKEFDENEIKRVIKVALWCIQENPVNRPRIERVVGMLEGVETIDDPPFDCYHFTVEKQGYYSEESSITGDA